MFQTLQAWWHQRQDQKWLNGLAKAGKGYAVRMDRFSMTTPRADREQLAQTIQTWLTEQLSRTATPYGISQYLIGIGWIAHDGITRTPLGKQTWDILQRTDAPDVMNDVAATIPRLTVHPTTTHLETYLLSLGDMLNAQ